MLKFTAGEDLDRLFPLRRKKYVDAASGNESQKEETARGSCASVLFVGSGASELCGVWGCCCEEAQESAHIQLNRGATSLQDEKMLTEGCVMCIDSLTIIEIRTVLLTLQ